MGNAAGNSHVGFRSPSRSTAIRGGIAALVVLAQVRLASAAEAPAPVEETRAGRPLEMAGRFAYASAPIRGAVNPFGAGFGVRIGYVLSALYLGATASYYLGGSDVGASDRALLFGAQLGLGIPLGTHVTLRPTFGAGDVALSHTEPLAAVDVVTTASGSAGQNSVTTTVNNVYVEPGLTVLFTVGAPFAAITADALVVPGISYGPAPAQSTTWISYSLEGELGLRF
jgi:hypothetical protein